MTTDGDVLVIFGITGDLAKVMTFHSLYRLEKRGLLNVPIVGVAADHWSTDDLRKHASEAIEATGEQVDPDIFDRLAGRMSYQAGDFADPSTYQHLAATLRGVKCPVFYLEIPPSLFGTVVQGLAEAGADPDRPGDGGEAVRPRPRLGPGPGRPAAPVRGRGPAVPGRPLPRQDGPGGAPVPAVRQHHARAGVEPQPRGVGADHDGRELRRRGPGPLLRRGGRAARRLREPPAAAARLGRDGAAGRPRPGHHQEPAGRAVELHCGG